MYFTGKQSGKNVLLQWQVNKETDLARYIVEKSVDGSDYSSLAAMKADGSINYSYTDNVEYNTSSNVYYRLKKVDKNGVFSYSSVFKLNISSEKKIVVYPNPARNYIHLVTENYYSKPVEVLLTDALGRTVLHQSFVSVNGQVDISTQNLLNGNYYLRVSTTEKVYSTNVLIAK